MASQGAWKQWVKGLKSYTPESDFGSEVARQLEQFQHALLSKNTAVRFIHADSSGLNLRKETLDYSQLSVAFKTSDQQPKAYQLYFVNKLLVDDLSNGVPDNYEAKLQVSPDAFRLLMAHCNAPVGYLSALARSYLPCTQGYRQSGGQHEIWYSLPTRVQVKCSEASRSHAKSTAGSNQMDAFHYLHIPAPGIDDNGQSRPAVDVRGSQVTIFARHSEAGKTTCVSVNFMDGRWSRIAEEPQQRIYEVLKHQRSKSDARDPVFIHLVFLTAVLRWYGNSLQSVNGHLIQHEKSLQAEMAAETSDQSAYFAEVNKTLHATAAHLHRYRSELDSILSTTNFISDSLPLNQESRYGLENARNQLKSSASFCSELDRKIQNILALLFNRIQIDHDRRLIANGVAMHGIMQAQQQETAYSRDIAIRSQELAEDMKKDSISMKTIALLTLLFLPATSFAALLAMPFFSSSTYFQKVDRLWIWAILTVPTTAVAYAFYYFYRKREEKRTVMAKHKRLSNSNVGINLRRVSSQSGIADSV